MRQEKEISEDHLFKKAATSGWPFEECVKEEKKEQVFEELTLTVEHKWVVAAPHLKELGREVKSEKRSGMDPEDGITM